MFVATKAHRRGAAEDKLNPSHKGQKFAQPAVDDTDGRPDAGVCARAPAEILAPALLEVTFQVHTHADLHGQHDHDPRGVAGVYISFDELTAAVHVSEEVCRHRHHRAEDLKRDMPPRTDDAQHHAGGKDHSERGDHEEDMGPEDAVDRIRRDDLAFGDLVVLAAMGNGGDGKGDQKEEHGDREERYTLSPLRYTQHRGSWD